MERKMKKDKKKTGKTKGAEKARIRSMTGFGKGVERSLYGDIIAEIKSLNHRHLSVDFAPFEGFFLLEKKLKDIFTKRLARGKVFVKISREKKGKKALLEEIQINEDMIKEYASRIKTIQKDLALKGDLKIQDLMGFPGVIKQDAGEEGEKLWPFIKRAAEKALKDLVKYREKEGAKLAKDFSQRLKKIRKGINSIKKREKQAIEGYRKRRLKMTKMAAVKEEIDKGKLEEEVALFARNCDITEELVRLENHLDGYSLVLKKAKGDVGKKLDFIAQEMHREANTIGAKGNDYLISSSVIDIKSEIEKIREQLKNIE